MTSRSNAIRALQKFASCDVGDALVKLNVPQGGYLSGLRMFSPGPGNTKAKVFGPAYTIRMVPASDKSSPTPPHYFVDRIPRGSVVFVSQPKGLISACWGGLMSTRAKRLGANGVVIDGRFRDINEHQELGMGLFARDISILGSNTFTRASALNVPVAYENKENGQEVIVNPGDYILGDVDGLVAVPADKVEVCARLCQERYDIDEETRNCLEQGDEMGPTIKRLRK
ncbi:ribonuclease E inhibitor RraA/Dimethylmenaquinone methyltransferase [Aspergillus avenaceus]|uniref:Ribonuclease E inhibitor RraA/Dimethylmenaquinone methyltransferase n=1 Tax=Aspergillus avenaceus TaxID=36643 RepID=A0A5N6TKW6_ASPAV|nr:ribonuclease E inhibitor RraA/Dimethylmenaquinone methyltransferase [Aspergillus avenaceus]